jgi:hypothetical protein
MKGARAFQVFMKPKVCMYRLDRVERKFWSDLLDTPPEDKYTLITLELNRNLNKENATFQAVLRIQPF